MQDADVTFLQRAIRLAMAGRGGVEPNPMVGCVLVKNDRVIGEGIHAHFGGPHAEPTALANCTESPEGATAYVTLEPCCHTDKKTPPCAPRLIAAKIARVVIGCVDPNPKVDGKGVAMLRAAGIEIDLAAPEIEAEAKQLIAPFIARTQFNRPYVTLKWAQTADGKVAGPNRARLQISGPAAMRALHGMRSRCDAILVGINTVLADDPLLSARNVQTSRLRRRIILDCHLRTPADSRIASSTSEGDVDLHYTTTGFLNGLAQIKSLMKTGINLFLGEEMPDGRLSLPKLLQHESLEDVTHLLVEPGPTLAQSFFDAGAADRVWIIRSTNSLNQPDAINAPKLPSRYIKTGEVQLDADVMSEYLDKESDVFFSAAESADLVLTQEMQLSMPR